MELSKSFIDNLHTTDGEAGKNWLEQLPSHLDFLSKQWNFRFIKPVSDLSYNFVALVELNTNHEVVILKTAPTGRSILLIQEAHWLKCFHKGTPHIFEMDENKNAFLMERLVPGETLKSLVKAGQDETATRILCQTILELHSEDPAPLTSTPPSELASYQHISELASALAFLKGHRADNMLSKAKSLFFELSSDRKNDVLLHGDLHHDNILKSGSTWKVIDPHGYIGDPAAESSPMIFNPLDCFPQNHPLKHIIDMRLKILCEMLPFDPQRIKAWCFCRTLLSAAWDVEGFGQVLNNTIEIAQAIDKIKI